MIEERENAQIPIFYNFFPLQCCSKIRNSDSDYLPALSFLLNTNFYAKRTSMDIFCPFRTTHTHLRQQLRISMSSLTLLVDGTEHEH